MGKLKIQGNLPAFPLTDDRIAWKDNLEMGEGWITKKDGSEQNKACAQHLASGHYFSTFS
jgi:hypothetical protein